MAGMVEVVAALVYLLLLRQEVGGAKIQGAEFMPEAAVEQDLMAAVAAEAAWQVQPLVE